MYKILIDSTQRYEKSVKLKKNGDVVGEKKGDIDVVSSIKKLLEENELNVNDIDAFEANPGPGSFTGIKIGVTIANILNWATGKRKIKDLIKPEYGKEPNINR